MFSDVFGRDFEPSVNLNVRYSDAATVARGNILTPEKVSCA